MYLPRIADGQLVDRLNSAGAVIIEGPKACGKTETARQVAKSEVLLDIDENARKAIAIDPALVLDGKTPRLIDEWQIEPVIWNHIRRTIDQRQNAGQFILTGSSVPADDITRHTGAGRISRLHLRPMSLAETNFSSTEISLSDLLKGRMNTCKNTGHNLKDVIEQICIGGWPGNLRLPFKAKLDALRDYLQEIQRVDISRVDGVRRDPNNVARIIRSLARNVATTVSARTVASDAGGADGSFDDDTVRAYLSALHKLMIIEEQPAWSTHLRSRSILRKSPKLHFADPSLVVAALGADMDRLLSDLNLLGLLFESLVYRDLSIYAGFADAQVYHYRDNTGLEVDAIVETRSGEWCAFEIKLGTGQVEAAAANLIKFRDRLNYKKVTEPKSLSVITSTGYGYLRKDGISVIPIGALGP
jgi:predicted AAA+ superfamily ATPase